MHERSYLAFGGEKEVGAVDFYLCRNWRWPPVTQLGCPGTTSGCLFQPNRGWFRPQVRTPKEKKKSP